MPELLALVTAGVGALGAAATTFFAARLSRAEAAKTVKVMEGLHRSAEAATINAVTVRKGDATVTVDLTTKSPAERERVLHELLEADRAAHAG